MYPAFSNQIAQMNSVYQLYKVDLETAFTRLQQFEDIIKEEFTELNELITAANPARMTTSADYTRLKVGLADLLGDLIVYCASEAVRWNIPLDQVLAVIMSSNFSKLGADGKPIKDARDKFLKGPNYWKPEPAIHAVLTGMLTIDTEYEETDSTGITRVYLPPIQGSAIPVPTSTQEQASQNSPAGSDNPATESRP